MTKDREREVKCVARAQHDVTRLNCACATPLFLWPPHHYYIHICLPIVTTEEVRTSRSAAVLSASYSSGDYSQVARRSRRTRSINASWSCDVTIMRRDESPAEGAAPSAHSNMHNHQHPHEEHEKLLDLHGPMPVAVPSGSMRKVKSFSDTHRIRDVGAASGAASARSLRPHEQVSTVPGEGSEYGTSHYAPSVRSLASIGMGCTDGRKMVIKRVPTSPTELFHLVRPPTWVYLSSGTSFIKHCRLLSSIIQLTLFMNHSFGQPDLNNCRECSPLIIHTK